MARKKQFYGLSSREFVPRSALRRCADMSGNAPSPVGGRSRFGLRGGGWWTAIAAAAAIAPSFAYAAVTISAAATQNMSCSNGICAPTASDAVLNVTDLENLLASANTEVTTTGSGGVQAGSIDVDAPLSWSAANTLTLDAYDSIAVGKAVSIAGPGGLSLVTDDGGSGGLLSFGRKGSV